MFVLDDLHKFEPQEPGRYGSDGNKDTPQGGIVTVAVNLHEYGNEN